MSNEKPDERTGTEVGPVDLSGRAHKERAFKDDGRYIIFYDFEDEGGED